MFKCQLDDDNYDIPSASPRGAIAAIVRLWLRTALWIGLAFALALGVIAAAG